VGCFLLPASFLSVEKGFPVQRFETLDHTADIYLVSYGETLAEAYANAAYGMFCQIADVEGLTATLTVPVTVEAGDREQLVVHWLSELLYLHEVEKLIFLDATVTELSETRLIGTAQARLLAEVDPDRLLTPIKAVTYHQLRVRPVNDHWRIEVVLDI